LAAAIAVAAALAPGAAPASVPAKHSFSGRISGATGSYRGDGGTVAIELSVPSNSNRTRPVTAKLRGNPCGRAPNCLRLRGKVDGTLTAIPGRVADVGARFSLKATGAVAALGRTAVKGTVNGTGFIASGHERMQLILTTPRGTVTVDASSPTVPGFTSP
jgi:hypothetical protein